MDLRDVISAAIDSAALAADHDGWPKTTYRLGGLALAVHSRSSGGIGRMLTTIEARSAPELAATSTVYLVDQPLPGMEQLLPPLERRATWVLRANDDVYYLWLDEAGGYVTAVDRRSGHALVWFTQPDRIASWHIARPMLHAIKGLSFATPWTPIHSAGVALDGRGLLFVGQSGAGKTSLAIGCALAGWDYLGDDAVIVRSGPARVGALYSSARLREDTFERFEAAMGASLGISDDAGELKAELNMKLLRPLDVGEAAIRAIVMPRRTADPELRLERIRPAESVRIMMEAARQSIIGDEVSTFAKLSRLAAEVPSYALNPGQDSRLMDEALRRLAVGG